MKQNESISITSNGGYIGRLVWWNTGTAGCAKHFGDYSLFPVTILGAWAGSIPVVRLLTR
jgi:hypothetical protein